MPSDSLPAMPSSQGILFYCLLLVCPTWGEHCGRQMKGEMKEAILNMIKQEIREEVITTIRQQIKEEMMEVIRQELREEMVDTVKQHMKEEMREMREARLVDMDTIREEKTKLEEKVGELTKKLEDHKEKVLEFEVASPKDIPYMLVCAHQEHWTTLGATISYDRLTADYNNADRPGEGDGRMDVTNVTLAGGGDGSMDINTGIFTAVTAGFYTVTYSGIARLDPAAGGEIEI